ncbi:MAG: hypothetical protein GY742_16065 [Hyphomicrobiales bacterium]|nr:hypothetical protein [Hyphomicrobiales bacterium]
MKILKAMGLALSVFGLFVGNSEQAEAVPATFGANAYEYIALKALHGLPPTQQRRAAFLWAPTAILPQSHHKRKMIFWSLW